MMLPNYTDYKSFQISFKILQQFIAVNKHLCDIYIISYHIPDQEINLLKSQFSKQTEMNFNLCYYPLRAWEPLKL